MGGCRFAKVTDPNGDLKRRNLNELAAKSNLMVQTDRRTIEEVDRSKGNLRMSRESGVRFELRATKSSFTVRLSLN